LDKLVQVKSKAKTLIKTLLKKAEEFADVPFPGYSHTQQAMLTSLGHYYACYAESLLDDLENLNYTHKILNKNPLGSAAGFGSNLELDRELTTEELGFDSMIINSLYAQNTRGKLDSIFAEAMSQIMLSLNKIANDFLLFTTREFSFFDIPDHLTTGSSIMPQKRNLDLFEIMKGKSSIVISKQLELKNIYKDGISGYNREIQFTKQIILEVTDITESSLKIVDLFIKECKPNSENIQSALKKDIFSADIATQMSKEKGIPFREAYKLALKKAEEGEFDLNEELSKKKSLGSAGNLGLDLLKEKFMRLG
jgi:argininosuccinate lyase